MSGTLRKRKKSWQFEYMYKGVRLYDTVNLTYRTTRKKVENGGIRKYRNASGWASSFRRAFRDSSSNSGTMQFKREASNNDAVYGGQNRQKYTDNREGAIEQSNGNSGLTKNSNQSSFSLYDTVNLTYRTTDSE